MTTVPFSVQTSGSAPDNPADGYMGMYTDSGGWRQLSSDGIDVRLALGRVNPQTGATYTILGADEKRLIHLSYAGAVAVTLPLYGNGWMTIVSSGSATTATITPSSGTINGSASLTIPASSSVSVFSDGSNYLCALGGISSVSGSAGGDLSGTYPNPSVSKASASFLFSGSITPSQITSDQNDYNPTGLPSATVLRLSTDAERTITGISGGVDGRLIVVENVGVNNIILFNGVGSAAENRFSIYDSITLLAKMSASFIYDGTSSRWRPIDQAVTRATLGLATTDSPQFAAVNIGAEDTTITRVSAGVIAVEGVTIATNNTANFLVMQVFS